MAGNATGRRARYSIIVMELRTDEQTRDTFLLKRRGRRVARSRREVS